MHRFDHVLLGAAITAGLAAASPPSTPARLAITNVTVIDATGAPPRHGVTVLLADQRIAALTDTARSPAPDARVVDGTGRYLIPGLTDMHIHLAVRPEPELAEPVTLPLLVAHGVTTVRDMGGDWQRLEGLRRAAAGGHRSWPEILTPGPFLDGPQPADPSVLSVATGSEARAAVRALRDRGVDFVKIQAALSRESFFAAAEEAQALGIPFAGHAPEAVSAVEASDAGQRSLEHVSPALPGDAGILLACSSREDELRRQLAELRAAQQRPDASAEAVRARSRALQAGLLDSYDPDRAAAVFARLARNGTAVVPTLIWSQSFQPLSADDRGADVPLRYVHAAMRQRWIAGRQRWLEAASAEQLALNERMAERSRTLVGELRRAGVRLLAGTDSLDAFVLPGDSLHRELELLVRAGLSPLEALQAATRSPAEFLGRLASAGTVEVGKAADLVMLDADPLADIRNTRKIAGVVRRGAYVSRADLDEMLAAVEVAGFISASSAALPSSSALAGVNPASGVKETPPAGL